MLKQIFIWVTGAFLLLQFIQIDIPKIPNSIDPYKEIDAPTSIASLLKKSCYDCHSYETKIPWYGHISPFSLEVKSHIKNGRAALNFQEWKNYTDAKKQKIYRGIVKTIRFRMPIPMYLSVHKEARLTQPQRNQIKNWAKSLIQEDDYK